MIALVIILIIAWVIGFTILGCKMCKGGNPWGALVAFLGLGFIGSIVAVLFYISYQNANVKSVNIVKEPVNNDSQNKEGIQGTQNKQSLGIDENLLNEIQIKTYNFIVNKDFESAKNNIQILKNFGAKKNLKIILEDVKSLISKSENEDLLLKYSEIIKLITNIN